MGALYDLAVPFSDCEMGCPFCVRWHTGDEVELEGESDLTLTVTYSEGCELDRRTGGLEEFYSDGFKANGGLKIVFSDWVDPDWDRM
jgi:hypothetical protein